MTAAAALLNEIEVFVAETNVAKSTFGRKAVNDGKLVKRLESGGSVTLEVAAAIRTYMAKKRSERQIVETCA